MSLSNSKSKFALMQNVPLKRRVVGVEFSLARESCNQRYVTVTPTFLLGKYRARPTVREPKQCLY